MIASFCGNCGAPASATDRFCTSCGHELIPSEPERPSDAKPSLAAGPSDNKRRRRIVAICLGLLLIVASGATTAAVILATDNDTPSAISEPTTGAGAQSDVTTQPATGEGGTSSETATAPTENDPAPATTTQPDTSEPAAAAPARTVKRQVKLAGLFKGTGEGRCFTPQTNPGSSLVVTGTEHTAGFIQCGGHGPPEKGASGRYRFSQPASIPVDAILTGFSGTVVVDETPGARPAEVTLDVLYDGKRLCRTTAQRGAPQDLNCSFGQPRPADFAQLEIRQTVQPDQPYVWAGLLNPQAHIETDATQGTTPANPAPPSDDQAGTAEAAASADKSILRGQGSRVMTAQLAGTGPVVVRASHSGASNFIVDLVGQGLQESLFNEIGSVQAAMVVTDAPPGRYRVAVQADGAWTLRFTRPQPAGSERPLLGTINGSGSRVIRVRTNRELQPIITATHRGDGNFIVDLVGYGTVEGEINVFNEIGPYDGEALTYQALPAGTYLLEVYAPGGSWSLHITP